MSQSCQTFAVRLTPPGRGALASVLVAGLAARDVVGRMFCPNGPVPWNQTELRSIRFGRWGGQRGEDVVVAPLAVDQVEIHCHGGDAAAKAILATLAGHGCRELSWRDWLARSHTDPLAAEAAIALAQALTERVAAILLDQHQGALRRAVADVHAHLESGATSAAAAGLDALLKFASLGLRLIDPWRIVIAGCPNVGKSSLINALLGYQRAIVCELPGTTRDVVSAVTAFDGWPVELSDTAGLRAGGDALESAGMERTLAGVAAADLVLLVREAGSGWTAPERQLADSGRPILQVLNKCDLIAPGERIIAEDAVQVSALTGTGLDVLIAAITRRLIPAVPAAGAAVPFSALQVDALESAQSALRRNDTTAATSMLLRLLT